MEAFYVSIIFLGVLLVIGSLFFIAMDRVNGKDFFIEFDRKKDEMFNLIQDSEEMIQELNRMSDYVVSIIAEKNQEYFNKQAISMKKEPIVQSADIKDDKVQEQIAKTVSIPGEEVQVETSQYLQDEKEKNPEVPVIASDGNNTDVITKMVNTQFSHNNMAEGNGNSDLPKSKLVLNSRRREVLKLIEQGLSNDEICDKLKIGKGEIGLIRGLSK